MKGNKSTRNPEDDYVPKKRKKHVIETTKGEMTSEELDKLVKKRTSFWRNWYESLKSLGYIWIIMAFLFMLWFGMRMGWL